MREFLQTAIPVVLTAVLAGQVAVTRTGRLRKDILANLDLLDRLPADCPNRAELEVKNGELVGVLARRQRRRYGPFTQAGFSLGVLAGLAGPGGGVRRLLGAAGGGGPALEGGLGPADLRGLLVQRGVLPVLYGPLRLVGGLVGAPAAPRAPGAGAAADRGGPCLRLSRPAGPGSPLRQRSYWRGRG